MECKTLEDKNFYVFGKEEIKNGSQITINKNVDYKTSSNKLMEVISDLKTENKTLEDIDECLNNCIEKENEIYKEIESVVDKWVECSKNTNILLKAKKYINKCKEIKNYNMEFNKWEIKQEWNNIIYTIKNKTYILSFRIYLDKNFKTNEIERYDISYYLNTNNFFNNKYENCRICSAKKTVTSKEEAEKYIKGRIKAYSKYFKEEYPPVLKEFANNFKEQGILLEPYRVVDKI